MTQKSSLGVHASIIEALGTDLSLSDLEAVRLILRGNSIIDWNRANFRSLEEADRFFRLHLFNSSNPVDLRCGNVGSPKRRQQLPLCKLVGSGFG